MVAILNLLDLRSIMGCPWGTHSVFTCAFRAKRELQCMYICQEKGDHYYTQTRYNNLFFPIISILFLGKFKEKFTPKACM